MPEGPGPGDISSVKMPAQLAVQAPLAYVGHRLDPLHDLGRGERLAEDAQ